MKKRFGWESNVVKEGKESGWKEDSKEKTSSGSMTAEDSWATKKKRKGDEGDKSEDGYKWCKYGEKPRMDKEYIRSYYRCSNKETNCFVKKIVDRHRTSPSKVKVTYDGEHNHPPPIAKEVIIYHILPDGQHKIESRHHLQQHQLQQQIKKKEAVAPEEQQEASQNPPERMGACGGQDNSATDVAPEISPVANWLSVVPEPQGLFDARVAQDQGLNVPSDFEFSLEDLSAWPPPFLSSQVENLDSILCFESILDAAVTSAQLTQCLSPIAETSSQQQAQTQAALFSLLQDSSCSLARVWDSNPGPSECEGFPWPSAIKAEPQSDSVVRLGDCGGGAPPQGDSGDPAHPDFDIEEFLRSSVRGKNRFPGGKKGRD